MRIRSIRPEFWSSEDVAEMDWYTRLVYIGLWSYVDDNGVGRDKERLITAALFPLDEDLPESSRRVTGALRHLSSGGQITRYAVDGKPYLHVAAWTTHQRIEKASKGRYPLPTCDNAEITESSQTIPVVLPEPSPPGEGEKGRRGEGEKGIPPTAGRGEPGTSLAVVRDDAPTAQTLVGEWIDHCGERPPGRVIGQVSKELKALLDEGVDPDRVRRALAEWNRKGLHPSTLPSVVHEIGNRSPAKTNRQAAEDAMWERAMDRAIEREREMGLRP